MILGYKKAERSMTYVYYFSLVNVWNSLPEYVVHADTVNCFKSRGLILIYDFRAKICGTGS